MLSRVAERMYWFGRYLERVENTARLVNVNASLLLDMPRIVSHIWSDLVNITGSSTVFYEHHKRADERSVVKFLLADESNPGSILSSLKMVRENIRTTREIMPSECWEQINELQLHARQHVADALRRDGRHEFLDDIMHYCYQITGLLQNNMSHGEAYNFSRIGRNLERTDMTTRIIDVGCINLLSRTEGVPEAYDNILWMNILRSLSAYQMYRQHVHDRVNGEDVVAFLMQDDSFPRAISHCLSELNHCAMVLPNNDLPLRSITRVRRRITELDVAGILDKLHELIDEIQVDMADIHNQVSATWFEYSDDVTSN